MKRFFTILFFVGCAVKCDDSSNYYVIEMPAVDPQQSRAQGPQAQPLQVYWNVPTMQCKSKKIPFKNLMDRFGIIQNANDSFRGEAISILYDPGIFPALLYNSSTGQLRYRNGGVPQEGDLQLHLSMFASVLNQSIPDKDFSGIGIIDFESWRPILRQNFGEVYPYKTISYDIERQRHWLWPQSWIQAEAKQRFEEAAQKFMQNTIALAKQMRPLAQWGYYGFPYCFNMASSTMAENCASNVQAENDQIDWLWMESTALYPSVYSSKNLSSSQLGQLIRGRVREAARVRREGPILPYFWFRYRDGDFLKEVDLATALKTFNQSESDGFIIWGSSNDVNTPDKCQKLLNYIENVMGPAIARYTKPNSRDYDDPDNSTADYNDDYSTESSSEATENTIIAFNEEAQFDEGPSTQNPLEHSVNVSFTVTNDPFDRNDVNSTSEVTQINLTTTEAAVSTSESYSSLENDTFTSESREDNLDLSNVNITKNILDYRNLISNFLNQVVVVNNDLNKQQKEETPTTVESSTIEESDAPTLDEPKTTVEPNVPSTSEMNVKTSDSITELLNSDLTTKSFLTTTYSTTEKYFLSEMLKSSDMEKTNDVTSNDDVLNHDTILFDDEVSERQISSTRSSVGIDGIDLSTTQRLDVEDLDILEWIELMSSSGLKSTAESSIKVTFPTESNIVDKTTADYTKYITSTSSESDAMLFSTEAVNTQVTSTTNTPDSNNIPHFITVMVEPFGTEDNTKGLPKTVDTNEIVLKNIGRKGYEVKNTTKADMVAALKTLVQKEGSTLGNSYEDLHRDDPSSIDQVTGSGSLHRPKHLFCIIFFCFSLFKCL